MMGARQGRCRTTASSLRGASVTAFSLWRFRISLSLSTSNSNCGHCRAPSTTELPPHGSHAINEPTRHGIHSEHFLELPTIYQAVGGFALISSTLGAIDRVLANPTSPGRTCGSSGVRFSIWNTDSMLV